jgi:hypothetical protein
MPPYFWCNSSMKKIRRPPTTAFLRGRLVKRDQAGPGIDFRGEMRAVTIAYDCQVLLLIRSFNLYIQYNDAHVKSKKCNEKEHEVDIAILFRDGTQK